MADKTFTLSGRTYKLEAPIPCTDPGVRAMLLSLGSCRYVVRFYKPSSAPSAKVLDALHAQNLGYVTYVLEHGQQSTPQGNIIYDMQPYFDGGPIAAGSLHGKPTELKQALGTMLISLKAAHTDVKVAHSDVRPENFIYADTARSQLVLCNFQKAKPVNSVIEMAVKDDYLALGKTLIALWSGRYTDTIPTDLPKDLVKPLQGFMANTPSKRWGFDECLRWLKGEDVPTEAEEIEAERLRKDAQAQKDANAYRGLGGLCYTVEQIGKDIAEHPYEYLDILTESDALLYKYSDRHGLKIRENFLRQFKENKWTALWRLVFTLYPSIGFPMYKPSTNSYTFCPTLDKLLEGISSLSINAYREDKCWGKESIPALLLDDAFVIWLTHHKPEVAGRAKQAQQKLGRRTNAAHYYVLYMLDPKRNYYFESRQDSYFSMEQLAQFINKAYLDAFVCNRDNTASPEYKKGLETANELLKFEDSRLLQYLRAKGIYQDKIAYIRYCFDLSSKDNTQKVGPYNQYYAFFKAVKGLAGKVNYYFPKSKVTVSQPSELALVSDQEKKAEISRGDLLPWLATFYQEDPQADLSTKYAYETLLVRFTQDVGIYDPDCAPLKRFGQANQLVNSNVYTIKKLLSQCNWLRIGLFSLAALPSIALALVFLLCGTTPIADRTPWLVTMIFFMPLWIGSRIIQALPKVDEWMAYAFGPKLGEKLYGHRWIVGFIYTSALLLGMQALEYLSLGLGRWVIPALCLLALAWRYKRVFIDYSLRERKYKNAINPDLEATALEPMGFAWKDLNAKSYESSTTDQQKTYIKGLKAARYFITRNSLHSLWLVFFMSIAALLISKPGVDWIRTNNPSLYETIYAPRTPDSGDGAANSAPRYVVTGVKHSLTVRQHPAGNATPLGHLSNGQEITVIQIDPETGFALIDYNGTDGYVNAKYIKILETDEVQ